MFPKNPAAERPRPAAKPGSVRSIRELLEAEIRKVAWFQARFFRPHFIIKHVGPNVAIVSLVGMRWITAKQFAALRAIIERHRQPATMLILTLGKDE